MKPWKRTHNCGDVNADLVGQTITINGWINRRRDLGGLIFVDVRDRWGLVQVVFNPETLAADVFSDAERLRSEFVISVTGTVAQRPDGQVNRDMASGAVEVHVAALHILSDAKTPPFHLDREPLRPLFSFIAEGPCITAGTERLNLRPPRL